MKRKDIMAKEAKLALMRDCELFGKSWSEAAEYFRAHGYPLSRSTWDRFKRELKSAQATRQWFSREALHAMEEDHMLSVERIRMMENRLLQEFEGLAGVSYAEYGEADRETQAAIRAKSHLLLKIIAQFQSLQETKTKMFSATPLVQEIMTIHERQQQETEAGARHAADA